MLVLLLTYHPHLQLHFAGGARNKSEEEASSAGVHRLVIVHPLILATLAVKGTLLQAEQLEGEARPQLLQASYHPP